MRAQDAHSGVNGTIWIVARIVSADRQVEYAHAEALVIVNQPPETTQNIVLFDLIAQVADFDEHKPRFRGDPVIKSAGRAPIARRDHTRHLAVPAIQCRAVKARTFSYLIGCRIGVYQHTVAKVGMRIKAAVDERHDDATPGKLWECASAFRRGKQPVAVVQRKSAMEHRQVQATLTNASNSLYIV